MDTWPRCNPDGKSPLTKYNCVSEGFIKGYVTREGVIFRTGLQILRARAGHPDCVIAEAGDLMHYDPKADVIHNLTRASFGRSERQLPDGRNKAPNAAETVM